MVKEKQTKIIIILHDVKIGGNVGIPNSNNSTSALYISPMVTIWFSKNYKIAKNICPRFLFPVWLRNRLKSAGLEPVFRYS